MSHCPKSLVIVKKLKSVCIKQGRKKKQEADKIRKASEAAIYTSLKIWQWDPFRTNLIWLICCLVDAFMCFFVLGYILCILDFMYILSFSLLLRLFSLFVIELFVVGLGKIIRPLFVFVYSISELRFYIVINCIRLLVIW